MTANERHEFRKLITAMRKLERGLARVDAVSQVAAVEVRVAIIHLALAAAHVEAGRRE